MGLECLYCWKKMIELNKWAQSRGSRGWISPSLAQIYVRVKEALQRSRVGERVCSGETAGGGWRGCRVGGMAAALVMSTAE